MALLKTSRQISYKNIKYFARKPKVAILTIYSNKSSNISKQTCI